MKPVRQDGARLSVDGLVLQWPDGVPPGARFEPMGAAGGTLQGVLRHKRGAARVTWALQDDAFNRAGTLMLVSRLDREGRLHGLATEHLGDGAVHWRVPWVRGQMHGVARQLDENGSILVRSRFIRGTGVDVWASGCGRWGVSEVREMRDSKPHGVTLWGHPRLPWEEEFYIRGLRTGVFRRWKGLVLEPGYPEYFLDGHQVSRADYVRARRRRPELVPDRRADDARPRPLLRALRRSGSAPTSGPTCPACRSRSEECERGRAATEGSALRGPGYPRAFAMEFTGHLAG
jgi:hypothetical protein